MLSHTLRLACLCGFLFSFSAAAQDPGVPLAPPAAESQAAVPIDQAEMYQKVLNFMTSPGMIKLVRIASHPQVVAPLQRLMETGNYRFLGFAELVLMICLMVFRWIRLHNVQGITEWFVVSSSIFIFYMILSSVVVPLLILGTPYGALLRGLVIAYRTS